MWKLENAQSPTKYGNTDVATLLNLGNTEAPSSCCGSASRAVYTKRFRVHALYKFMYSWLIIRTTATTTFHDPQNAAFWVKVK